MTLCVVVVVAPLLALMLADGDSLVMAVVPKALLEMTRKLMKETFSQIMCKRVFTLHFDRATEVTSSIPNMLSNIARDRGIVVATPTTVKSIFLCFIEALVNLKQSQGSAAAKLKTTAAELFKTLKLFREGVMLLDEVDLVLHPLKSELNFPTGEKFPLDASESGERWGLPIHLVDAIFFTQTGSVSVFEQQGNALHILKRLAAVIQAGIVNKSLQRLPHITLLDKEFYHSQMKPVLAEWSYLWLQKQHLHGISREEAVQYVLEGAAAKSENATKMHLIHQEMQQIEVKLGIIHEEPEPTAGLRRSGSDVAKKWEDNSRLLQRQSSLSHLENTKLLAQLAELRVAHATSKEQAEIISEIYSIDQDYEARLKLSSAKLAEVEMLWLAGSLTTCCIGAAPDHRDNQADRKTGASTRQFNGWESGCLVL